MLLADMCLMRVERGQRFVLCIDRSVKRDDVLIGKPSSTGKSARELLQRLGERGQPDAETDGVWHQRGGVLVQAYAQGDEPCGDTHRAALVKYACLGGPSRAPFIVLVREADACTVVIQVHVPSLCARLKRPEAKARVLECH